MRRQHEDQQVVGPGVVASIAVPEMAHPPQPTPPVVRVGADGVEWVRYKDLARMRGWAVVVGSGCLLVPKAWEPTFRKEKP